MCPACLESVPKPRKRLLSQYGSLDGIYEQLDEITKKKAREALEHNREQAYLSKQLVTIDTDVDIDCDWHRMHAYAA